ncbi:hypothetical protein Nepgr_005912 [Nepenthes gracilis]|uniref:Uncharacterized protein n=1 Tax=Nepenthes gracilis TaxID=150966 RepID=A0AAD3S467_NEPGR|nr:hypothetical protein Nepgr_005912 [Nepenthes gracilis]
MEAVQSPPPPPPPPPPLPPPTTPSVPTESIIQRYKVAWRTLIIFNLSLGAYMFVKAKHKDVGMKSGKTSPAEVPSPPSESKTTTSLVIDEEREIEPSPAAAIPLKMQEPIREDQQRELFKWMLEEKRKIKPKDREDKKRIDEDKSILKQFSSAESIPPL